MIIYILSVILLKNRDHPISKEERVINVKTFHDYKVDIEKADDFLIINVPKNTFLFISSIDGYEISVYNSLNAEYGLIKTITPNKIERLIYYVNEGSLKVTSTTDSLKFVFHTLPIDKLETSENEKIIIKHLIISTDPNGTIAFNAREDEFINEYYVYYEKNTFVWLITDKDILCMLKSKNLTYYNSNENENNEETIERKTVYSSSGEHVTGGKSKFC